MMHFITGKMKKHGEFFLSVFLWLCIWATYDTDIGRIFNPGFPHNILDLIHGLRSLLPFLALIIAAVILFKKKSLSSKFFLTPLGLLSVFAILGIISSVFSRDHFMAFYWGVLYGSVILVLSVFLDSKYSLKKIIRINWIIAGCLAIGLTVFFLIQPGAIKSLTLNVLVCSQRPYESLASIGAAINTFGVAGTRPTGLGRYAGIMAIVSFISFFLVPFGGFARKRLKAVWFFSFIIFSCILFFSKGKTEIVGFVAAIIFAVVAGRKLKANFILGTVFVILLSGFVVLYNIPCTNHIDVINPFAIKNTAKNLSPQNTEKPLSLEIASPEEPVNSTIIEATPDTLKLKGAVAFSTLSGRTTGVWADAWHLFLKNPLLGFGFQADRFFLSGQHAHNSIIHALIQAGILGTLPFILAFILVFLILIRLFASKKVGQIEKNYLIILSSVLVFFAVRSITESTAFFGADWLFVAPIIAYIQHLDAELNKDGDSKEEVLISLGNKINIIGLKEAVEKISFWIKDESGKVHWIIVTGMHGLVEAERRLSFKYILSSADIWVPDGISLVWLAKLKGFNITSRVSGADLMEEFFRSASKEGFSNYFYGDTEEILEVLNKKLLSNFPDLKIAGSYSPPFRVLTKEEDDKIIEKINQAKPDVLWVALGLPKQEKWIFEHRERLNVPVVVGVGAAFKFLSGKVKRAPAWVGSLGFEWLWRLIKEPKVTWKRVFIDMPFFMWLVWLELVGPKSYKE